jgi:hypothetical protein
MLALGRGSTTRIEALRFLGVAAARRRNLALLQEAIGDRNRLTRGAFFARVNGQPKPSEVHRDPTAWLSM